MGIKIGPETKFHGKVKKKLNNLKKAVLKRVKKKKGKEAKKYLLIGTVLHSIQDYQAHSYYSDVQPIRDRVEKGKGDGIKSKAKRKFHKDWVNKEKVDGQYKYNKTIHNEFKDNPYYDFVKKDGIYKWKEVKTRYNNQRYVEACEQSKKYLKKAMKKIK